MADPALLTFLKDRETLIALACRVVEDRAVAEDLVQDSWLRWHAKTYPATEARPIFRRIVKNLALDWTRRRKTEFLALEQGALLTDDSPCSERVVIARQDLALVVRALEQLPPRTVRAFRLRYVEGLTFAQIGARLGLSVSRAHGLTEDALVEITLALGA